jgi:hypothetical protein
MRKLTASLLAVAVLGGGALTGAAVAATGSSHATPAAAARVADRSPSAQHESSRDTARHERSSRDRSTDSTRDRPAGPSTHDSSRDR